MLVLFGVNFALLKAFQWRRYGNPQGEYAQKMKNALDAYAAGRPITAVFAGDSTVSVGIMPRLLGQGYLNIAWSGFDPSELELLEERLLSFPVVPSLVFIGINPTYLSENEWRNTFAVPAGTAFLDGIESFYGDTNSFKPVIMMSGLAALSNRFLVSPLAAPAPGREATGTRQVVEPDGLLVVDPEVRQSVPPREDLKLPFRRANFEMLQAFHRSLHSKGVRVIWLFMPHPETFERRLHDGASARQFVARYRDEIRRIFADDSIDLAGAVPDRFFRDDGHLTKAGARLLTLKLSECVAAFR
jgi:hypothetical protein